MKRSALRMKWFSARFTRFISSALRFTGGFRGYCQDEAMNTGVPTAQSGGWLPSPARTCLVALLVFPLAVAAVDTIPAPGTKLPSFPSDRVITAADVTVERVGTSIPVSAIGEPVGGVTLSPPRWFEATKDSVAGALVDGSIAPHDPKGKPINFRVLLPANWHRRAIQMGGFGVNGIVPMLRGAPRFAHGRLRALWQRFRASIGRR